MALAPLVVGTVRDMVRTGNTVYIAGSFTSVGGQTGFRNLARYNLVTGAVDTSWKPQPINNEIRRIVFSPDKQSVFIASNFSGYVQKWSTVTATQQNFIALSGNTVGCNDLLLDGNYLYAIGDFTTATPVGGSAVTRGRVVKIDITGNSNQGSVESAFNINISSGTCYAINHDSSFLYVGGDFTTVGGITAMRLVKVNKSNGVIANGWQATGSGKGFGGGTVRSIKIGTDGNLYVAGQLLSLFSGSTAYCLSKISKTGVLDAGFTATTLTGMNLYDVFEYSGSLYIACGTRANAGSAAVLKNTNGLTGEFTFDLPFISQIDSGNSNNGCRKIIHDGQNMFLGLSGTTYTGGPSYTTRNTAHVSVSTSTGEVIDLQADTTGPTVTLSATKFGNPVASGSTINGDEFSISVVFSESLASDPTSGNFSVTNGSISNFTVSKTGGSFSVTPSGSGAMSVSVSSGVFQDISGNTSSASNVLSFTVDVNAPTTVLSGSVANGATSTSAVESFTLTFSESVTGLQLSDLSVAGGVASNLAGSGTTYTFDFTPSEYGLVGVSYSGANGTVLDGVGNVAQDSNVIEWTYASANNPVVSPVSPTVARKEILNLSVSKSEIETLSGVSSAGTRRMLVVYSATGKPMEVCKFKASQATPTSKFFANINSSAVYEMQKVIVVKTDYSYVIVNRADITSPGQYDISVT